MSEAKSNGDLGPLPESDRKSEIQRISFVEIQAVLPTNKFIFRDERTEDAGVDASIELLSGSSQTNLRGQVQLKGTDSQRFNGDGSFSLQIDVANLNYLLNGVSSIYLIYIIPLKEFRFVWAHDERRRLDVINPNWMDQETITIRFSEVLTPTALDQIYDRILREGRMNRRIHDALAASSLIEQVNVAIDPATLSTTTAQEAYPMLLASGFTMVASGDALAVLRLSKLLSGEQTNSPRIQLVLAYAQYSLAQYQASVSHLQQATLRRNDLSLEDQAFLRFLRNASDFQAGSISLDEYCRRADDWVSKDPSGFALANRLDSTRYRLLKETDINERQRVFDELRSIAFEVLARDDNSKAFGLEAALVMLFADAGQRLTSSVLEIVGIPLRRALEVPVDIQAPYTRLENQAWEAWESSIADALQHADQLRHPLLKAFALLTRTSVRTTRMINLRLLADCTGGLIELSETMRLQAMRDAEQAKNIYETAGQLEGTLRATMHLADLYLLGNQREAAHALSLRVLPQAEAMEYCALVERAREHIDGTALPDKLRAMYEHASTADVDIGMASMTDDETRAFARDICEEKGLPKERLPIAEQDAFASRGIARERVHWCRHIDLIQDLTHTQSPTTMYTTDLKHDVICEKYGYRPDIGSSDSGQLIATFKETYCEGCPGREPKNSSLNTIGDNLK